MTNNNWIYKEPFRERNVLIEEAPCNTRNGITAGFPDGIFSNQKSQFINFGGPWYGKGWYIYVQLEFLG
jgi:hypothetical protein